MHLPQKAQSVVHFESLDKVQVTKLEFIWRALVFTVLELGFLVLATHCLTNPIPLLSSSISSLGLAEAKAVTTALAVAWHGVALFPVKGIISTVFSAECIAQYRRTGRLQPNLSDRVSCITSGLWAQISHFLTLRPTLEYRLAFLLVLSTVALVPLGPSVIGLAPSPVIRREDLQIANVTIADGFFSPSQQQCLGKANEIVSLELVENGAYGYGTQNNRTLIPWPQSGLETSQEIVKYESDVAVYNYTCRLPEFTFKKSRVIITEMANISWAPWNGALSQSFVQFGGDTLLPLANLQDDPPPSSAFIFVFDPKGHTNLSAIATSTNITKNDIAGTNGTITFQLGFVAVVVLCEPQYTIQRAEVTLQGGQLNATLVESPLLGNFPESAANSLFSRALLNAFAPLDVGNRPAMSTFIPDHGRQALLSLPEINQNMTGVIQSAAKAYISGYTGTNGSRLDILPSYTSSNQSVTVQGQKISLVSGKTFLVTLWGLDAVIVLILVILLCTTNVQEMRLLSLQTMETIYRDPPINDDDHSLSQRYHPKPYANKLGFVWRLIAFMVLEFGFLAFARYCLTNPIPVYLPSALSSSQAKSATTAVAVIWRTLAVFPIKDLISSVFSAECLAQYQKSKRLEPQKTDQVSRATSGLVDQVLHFTTRRPTLEYRIAFLLALLVIIISPLGPGVITLTESPVTRTLQGLRVANMTMDQGFASFDQRQISQRANTFVGLELLEGRMYGWDTVTEGVLIPWPESGPKTTQPVTMYESDVVLYNYSCHWPESFSTIMPVKSNGSDLGIVIPGILPNGTTWSAWGDEGANQLLSKAAIFPLIKDVGDGAIPGDADDTFDTTSRSPVSAVIFSGNSTLMDLGSTGSTVRVTPEGRNKTAMSLSVLLCDPQFKIQRANVTLSSDGKLSANVLPGFPLIGNFPETAANALFSQALMDTLGPEWEDPDRLLSPISMFLFTGGLNGTGPLQPFPLPVINDNMNRVLKSAAKAYLSGFNSSEDSRALSFSLWNQTATIQSQQLALVTSRSFFIGLLTLAALIVTVSVALSTTIDIGKMQLFNLETLDKIYADEALTKEMND